MQNVLLATFAAIMMITASRSAFAEEIEIKMLNEGAKGRMVFEPDFVRVNAGDTIEFEPIDMGHNAETIKGMIPSGAEPFKSKINAEFSVTLTDNGVYGIRCTPHYGLGMVALIVVGTPENVEEAEAVAAKAPPKAKKLFGELFAQVGAMQ
jgi:pseudoazurin